jgi:hypothetical protein
MKSVRFICTGGTGLLVLFFSVVLIRSYLYFHRFEAVKDPVINTKDLEVVEDPVIFTKEFEPAGKTPIELLVESKGGQWFGSRVVKSPLYPYKDMQTVMVKPQVCSGVNQGGQTKFTGEAGT